MSDMERRMVDVLLMINSRLYWMKIPGIAERLAWAHAGRSHLEAVLSADNLHSSPFPIIANVQNWDRFSVLI